MDKACTSYDADMRDASYIASFMQRYKKDVISKKK